jgi:hypothetical protein
MQTLAEDFLLIALDDEKGTVSLQGPNAMQYALGGALLMDLALLGRIDSIDKKIVVEDSSSTGDEVLDTSLESIRAASKPRDAKHWVKQLGGRKGLPELLARRLVARGILREQEHTFMWIFRDERFPTNDPGQESAIRDRIRAVVLDGAEPDTRTLLLLSLVHASNLTDCLFPKEERIQASRCIKELVEGEQFGKAVGGAIAEAIAVIASIAATTTVVTSSSSG